MEFKSSRSADRACIVEPVVRANADIWHFGCGAASGASCRRGSPVTLGKEVWPFNKVKRYEWKKEHTRLWKELVPPTGQADTLQGELIRVAGKLTDQAFRNGNMNWDADHERMWRYIGETIIEDPIFSVQDKAQLREKIEVIIRDQECPNLSGDSSPYYFVSEKVVDWCMAHPTPIPRAEDPTFGR